MSWALLIMAGAVSGAYFTIAALIVPRIQLANASPRFALLFRAGAVAFFVGCGLSHLHIAVHAVTDPEQVRVHELGFHALQVVGGWLFVFAALRYLDIRVDRKRAPDDARLEELQALALRDPLTGAYNRRHLEEVVDLEVTRLERHGGAMALLLIDVDDFKAINDAYGHETGDRVLCGIVEVINGMLRPTDVCARLGGDELAVVLPETGRMPALAVAERLRAVIGRHDFELPAPVTVSIGVASAPDDAFAAPSLFDAADRAMYWAKGNGKDRVALAAARRGKSGGLASSESGPLRK